MLPIYQGDGTWLCSCSNCSSCCVGCFYFTLRVFTFKDATYDPKTPKRCTQLEASGALEIRQGQRASWRRFWQFAWGFALLLWFYNTVLGSFSRLMGVFSTRMTSNQEINAKIDQNSEMFEIKAKDYEYVVF